ncbi:MAG: hypothetical protein WDW38_008082 [Sanguina aurantia]
MLKLLPGMNKVDDKKLYEQEKVFKTYAQMVAVMTEEERTTPELLAKSAGRRRRVAQESETSETEVAKFMASFATAKSQVTTMARRMQLGTSSPAGAEKLVKDLVASATRRVPEGKVRRKKEDKKLLPKAATVNKGFGKS